MILLRSIASQPKVIPVKCKKDWQLLYGNGGKLSVNCCHGGKRSCLVVKYKK